MPGRKYQAGTSSYRYSINGQEKDSELNENITTALYWEYDSRIGRRWNLDPIVKQYESPYMAFSGNPIWFNDYDGSDTTKPKSAGETTSKIEPSRSLVPTITPKPPLWTKPLNNPLGKPKPKSLPKFLLAVLSNPVVMTVGLSFLPMPLGTGDVPKPFIKPEVDNKPEDDGNIYVYRTMKQHALGKPLVGESKTMLGVVPEYKTNDGGADLVNNPNLLTTTTKQFDIVVLVPSIGGGGYVYSGFGGMSVSPTIQGLPAHRRPVLFGGTSKFVLFKIQIKYLTFCGLTYVQDAPSHGTIQPAGNVTYEAYKARLASTTMFWQPVIK